MKPILIAVLSTAGSTKEIAGIVADTFEKAGQPVEMTDLASGKNLDDYGGVVVAAPIHGMRWMPEAADYVSAQRTGLRTKAVALLAVSYLYFEGRSRWKASITKAMELVRAPLPHASVQVFGGRLPKALPAPARWLFGVKANRPLDLVDAAAVSAWAKEWVNTCR